MFKKNEQAQQKVTMGRFEMEENGKVAYLEYSIAGDILGLIHTEVPKEMRGKGIGAALAQAALDYARENRMKVDIVCPSVAGYIEKHPEFKDLIM